jgi:hypothetical protein
MNLQTEVHGQKINVWTRDGRVEAVMLRQNTDVWTEGGGGYVSGQHGGWVSPPQVRSQTTQFKEVRVFESDGSRRTVNVAGNVTIMPGDDVSFVYASPPHAKSGDLAAIINRTENQSWKYRVKGLIEYRLYRTIAAMFASPFIAFLLLVAGAKFYALLAGLVIFIGACSYYRNASTELDDDASSAIIAAINARSSAKATNPPPLLARATVAA